MGWSDAGGLHRPRPVAAATDDGLGGGRGVPEQWTVGADAVPAAVVGEWVAMPAGRLHAVSADGLITGRALCLASVTLLAPADWMWPDDGAEEWPPCSVCLAPTC